jgi:tetratricopeptide (TPR) repeat protein
VTHYKLAPPFSLLDPGYDDLYRRLTNQPKVQVPILGSRQALGPINPQAKSEPVALQTDDRRPAADQAIDDPSSAAATDRGKKELGRDDPHVVSAERAVVAPFINLANISAILGVVVTIIGVYTFVNDGTTATKVLFLASIVWLLFLVVAIKSPSHRRAAAIVLIAVPVSLGAGFLRARAMAYCSERHVCVVVAAFDRGASDTEQFRRIISDGLMDLAIKFPELDVFTSSEFIPSAAGKSLIPEDANRREASLVFWGDFAAPNGDAGELSFSYHVLRPDSFDLTQVKLFSGQVLQNDWKDHHNIQTESQKKAVCLTQLVLGLSAIERRQYQDAIVRLNAAFGTAASADLEQALPTIYLNRGRAKFNLQEFDEAIKDYSKAALLAPERTIVYRELGRAYYSKLSFDEAIRCFDRSLASSPRDKVSLNYRGLAYLRKVTVGTADSKGQVSENALDKAVLDFSAAFNVDKDFSDALNNRGVAYLALRKRDLAILDFGRAIELRKDFVDSFVNRARVYADARDWRQAIDDYSSAIKIKPGDDLAFTERGKVYASMGEFDSAIKDAIRDFNNAIEDYSGVLSRDPGNVTILYNRGSAHFSLAERLPASDSLRKGEFDKAIGDFSKIIVRQYLDPKTDPNVYYNIATIFREIGETGSAIVNFGEAIKLKPDFGAAYYNRGFAYERFAQLDLAMCDFVAAAGKATDDISRTQANAEIAKLNGRAACKK